MPCRSLSRTLMIAVALGLPLLGSGCAGLRPVQATAVPADRAHLRFDWQRRGTAEMWLGAGTLGLAGPIVKSGKLDDATLENLLDVATLDAVASRGKTVHWAPPISHLAARGMWFFVFAEAEVAAVDGLQYVALCYMESASKPARPGGNQTYNEVRAVRASGDRYDVWRQPLCVEGAKGPVMFFDGARECAALSAGDLFSQARAYYAQNPSAVRFRPLVIAER